MASTASPTFPCPIPTNKHKNSKPPLPRQRRRLVLVRASDSDDPTTARRKPVVDTRIHWSDPDEGWIGRKPSQPDTDTRRNEPPRESFADLINSSTSTHYQFLGVSVDADVEEIKTAYRRLSKEYHPDTTSLPLKAASEKFMQLREAYNVLSDDDRRKFYDWTLAQEAESRREQRMRMRLEDPYEQDIRNWETVPDTVDRLGGKNMKLSDEAMTALTIDVVIIIISICSMIYFSLFKEY